ncbi:ribonuclease III [Candidatus Latescibacterota bacterium]
MGFIAWLKNLVNKTARSVHSIDFDEVEAVIGYKFTDRFQLERSLKHRSYSQAVDGDLDLSNERLEFLGDSVLSLVVSHYLYEKYPLFQEGDLTKLKSALVSKSAAAFAGRALELERYVLLSDSEEDSGGRNRVSIVADMYEAIIGAIYIDGGLSASHDFIHRSLLDNKNRVLEDVQVNYKSLLLELSQENKLGHPVYSTISEDGPDHQKTFTVEVLIQGNMYGQGKGKSKKIAQQMAAKEGYKFLQEKINARGH